ncbi:hypothetical protein TMU3MR103_0139 [Tetragenococcus muriaticus 3MR10-3]|uniref:Uncharacterized protein n=1 Tax=Tetragenococcus muriaticus 3MR10-3 TaxID=1302648 RepID=A0A091C5F3_9ENTE|nr:hypothetical protein TMU3MR103_0139 [Tetragenococcus muriaticus 3MR10-3]
MATTTFVQDQLLGVSKMGKKVTEYLQYSPILLGEQYQIKRSFYSCL